MEKINEIKLPKGVESISMTQHDDRIVIEFIPEEAKFKRGDILISIVTPGLTVIFDKITSTTTFDSIYHNGESSNHYWSLESSNHYWSLKTFRHATEKEKQKFFDELKAEGKRWNAEKLEIEDWLEPWSDELKKGDLAIFWDCGDGDGATIRLYDKKGHEYHYDSYGAFWENAIKFESKEQFEKVLRGEID